MGERFYGVQALRFAAATAVAAAHAVDLAGTRLGLETLAGHGPLADFGAVGVDVFFVISGFVIAATTRGRSGLAAAGDFLWRRFRRVGRGGSERGRGAGGGVRGQSGPDGRRGRADAEPARCAGAGGGVGADQAG